jgi:hypothetical protein
VAVIAVSVVAIAAVMAVIRRLVVRARRARYRMFEESSPCTPPPTVEFCSDETFSDSTVLSGTLEASLVSTLNCVVVDCRSLIGDSLALGKGSHPDVYCLFPCIDAARILHNCTTPNQQT